LKTTGKNDKKPQKPKTSPTRKHRKAQKAKSWKKAKQRKNPFKLFLGTVILVLAVGYLAAGTYLYLNQRKFLYFPPAGVLPTAEQQIEIQSGDVTLQGWVVNPGNEDAIIYFGGNGERPEESMNDFKELFSTQTIYFINYRGYGESSGTPTEAGIYADAEAIFDLAVASHTNISVIGRSLGTGVATYLASNRDVHSLILVEPFDCLVNVAQSTYIIFPMQLMMKDKYDSAERAEQITAPTLIIIAENDDVIPRSSTDRLIAAFNPNILQVAMVEEATHNDIGNYTQYFMLMRDFIITN
jgi:fermentation-respiration switch protein FrsA (DUF1100 family)